MEAWKYVQLRSFCKKKILNFDENRLDRYWEALSWKVSKAEYHIYNYKNILKECESYKKSKSVLRGSDRELKKYLYSALMEVESVIETLNSLFDILAQIINLIVLDSAFSEHEVNFSKVVQKIKDSEVKRRKKSLIFKQIAKFDFIDYGFSNAFEYVHDFCNMIKHRSLIPASNSLLIDFTNRGKLTQGIHFVMFCYNRRKHPKMWADDIIDKYSFGILDIISNFGKAINIYLKKKYHLF